jgi:hypothetical protein
LAVRKIDDMMFAHKGFTIEKYYLFQDDAGNVARIGPNITKTALPMPLKISGTPRRGYLCPTKVYGFWVYRGEEWLPDSFPSLDDAREAIDERVRGDQEPAR